MDLESKSDKSKSEFLSNVIPMYSIISEIGFLGISISQFCLSRKFDVYVL